MKNKRKIPSSLSSTIRLSSSYSRCMKYINFSLLGKGCGPKNFSLYKSLISDTKVKSFSEIRTWDFRLTGEYFTAKLLAHNDKVMIIDYLNFTRIK